MQLTKTLGLPSHTRTLDSLSYFFITASTSIGPSAATAFFLNKANFILPFLKHTKIAAAFQSQLLRFKTNR